MSGEALVYILDFKKIISDTKKSLTQLSFCSVATITEKAAKVAKLSRKKLQYFSAGSRR